MRFVLNSVAALVLCSLVLFAGCSAPAAGPAASQQKPEALNESPSRIPAEQPEANAPQPPPPPSVPAVVKQKPKPAVVAKVADTPKQTEAAPTVFTNATALPPPPPPLPPPPENARGEETAAPVEPKPAIPEPVARQLTVPSGTLIAVRMIDSVDSETGHVGETFKATLDEPVRVDNETVFPKGAEAYVKLTKVQSAGNLTGKSELQLQLDRIFLGKKSYTIESNVYETSGARQGPKTARTAAIGAAIGTAIGAITGGGKGAVIGGATGAGAGVGIEAVTKGEQVRVDSETRLDFRLEQPIEVTTQSAQSAPSTDSYQPHDSHSGPVRFGTRPR